MARRQPKYVISLQSTHGVNLKVSFECSGYNAEKIVDLPPSDIAKDKKKKKNAQASVLNTSLRRTKE